VFKKIVLVGLLVAGLVVGATLPAQAAEEGRRNTVWAQSGGKTVFDDPLVPGNSYKRAVELYNDSDIQAIAHFSVQPYGATKDGKYNSTDIAVIERSELAKWVTYANGQDVYDVILEPRQTVEVPFTIAVPSNWVASGNQSAAVVISSEDYSPDKTDDDKGLAIETEYLHLLFANIQGTEPLRVDSKFVGLEVPSLMLDASQGLPIKLHLANDGNVWTTVKYHIKVVDKILYDAVAYETDGPKELLSDSQVAVEQIWEGLPDIGLVEVQATVTIGGEEFTEQKTVVAFPLWLIFIITTMIILLVAALILKIRKHQAGK
jgi:hypothetical protein